MSFLTEITQNSNFEWLYSPDDNKYAPGQGYTLTVALRGPSTINLTSTVQGTEYKVSKTSSETNYTPGLYQYSVYVTKTGERVILEKGRTTILPDPLLVVDETDFRTHAEKVLAALDAYIEHRATTHDIDVVEQEIAGRRLEFMSALDLKKLRDQYKQIVLTEKGKYPRRIINDFRTGTRV